jgi:peptidoglycan/xylan/chitin deacetylase (PgdA/CDA1 family)
MKSELKIIIHFDDAKESILSAAVGKLAKHSVPFSIFIPTFFIGKIFPGTSTRVMNASQLKEISQYANIGFHSHTHRNFNYLTSLQIKYEFFRGMRILERLNLKLLDTIALPGGHFSNRIITLALKHFKVVFSANDKHIQLFHKLEPLLPRYAPKEVDYDKLINFLKVNKMKESFLILLFHDIVDDVSNEANDFSTTSFFNLINFLISEQFVFNTTFDLINSVDLLDLQKNFDTNSIIYQQKERKTVFILKLLFNFNFIINTFLKKAKYSMLSMNRLKL